MGGARLVSRLRSWLALERTLARERCLFGEARVVCRRWRGRPARLLEVDGTLQSAAFTDGGWWQVPFPYLERLVRLLDEVEPCREVLLLGGGGFALAREVVVDRPGVRLTVAEIDPVMVRLAREHLFLDRLEQAYAACASGRLTILVEDALEALAAARAGRRRFDAILNDCFEAGVATPSLAGAEAVGLVHACLRPGGVYAVNVIASVTGSDSWVLADLASTLATSFAHVWACPLRGADREASNVVVVASDAEHRLVGAIPLWGA